MVQSNSRRLSLGRLIASVLVATFLPSGLVFASALKCSALVRQITRTMQASAKNSHETLNLGWDPLTIAESMFKETHFLEPVPLHLDATPTQRLQLSLRLDAEGRTLINEYRAQSKSKYNRERLDGLRAPLHETLNEYLSTLGVNLFRKKPDVFYGPYFSYVSIKGSHPLNRAARAIYNEYGLHVLISGITKIRIMHDYVQIPPQMFATKDGVSKIVTALTNLLVNADSLPAVLMNGFGVGRPSMQDASGSLQVLDWDKLENQIISVKSRSKPPSAAMAQFVLPEEQLAISKPNLQRVRTLENYINRLPPTARNQAAESLSLRIRENKKPFVYVGIEAADRWYEIWPTDEEPAGIESMISYVNAFAKDSRFIAAVEDLPEVRFHVIIGNQSVDPISAVDFDTFDTLESAIYSALDKFRKKYPPTYINLLKVSLNHGEVILFEPVKANPDSIEPK